jgi:hypothetical protein
VQLYRGGWFGAARLLAQSSALSSALCLGAAPLFAQQPATDAVTATPPGAPLPEVESFAAQVKARLRTDRTLQASYTFLERRQEVEVSKFGKVSVGSTKTYEVYPSLDPGDTYKRLVAVDGAPIDARELETNDAKHRKDLEDQEGSPEARAKHARDVAEERQKEHDAIDEIFRVYEMRIVGREDLRGYQTIVGTLEPRPSYKPRIDDGQVMKRFRARVWINEADYQLVRVDLEAIDDVTYGWGILGRLHKGARIIYERRTVNDEVWLPARLRIIGTGRSVLFRTFAIDSTTEWSEYKKFGVKTEESYSH